jgi:hypothetical protein
MFLVYDRGVLVMDAPQVYAAKIRQEKLLRLLALMLLALGIAMSAEAAPLNHHHSLRKERRESPTQTCRQSRQ